MGEILGTLVRLKNFVYFIGLGHHVSFPSKKLVTCVWGSIWKD